MIGLEIEALTWKNLVDVVYDYFFEVVLYWAKSEFSHSAFLLTDDLVFGRINEFGPLAYTFSNLFLATILTAGVDFLGILDLVSYFAYLPSPFSTNLLWSAIGPDSS